MTMSKSPRGKALAVAVVAAFGFATGAAQADVLATSVIQLNNFLLKNNATGVTLDASNFSFLTYTNTGDVGAGFTGYPSANPAPGAGTPLDMALSCSGPSCPAPGLTENGFEKLTTPVGGSFAAADQREQGAPITGLPGLATPAQVEAGAWAQVKSPTGGTASGTANNGLSGSFIFSLVGNTTIDIDFLATWYREVMVTADEAFPAFAQSRAKVNFNFVQLSGAGAGTTVFDWSPVLLNWNSALNAPLPIDVSIAAGATNQAFSNTAGPFAAGVLYQFAFTVENLADAQRAAPEPGTLALVGTALLGWGLTRRRRSQQPDA